MEDYFVITYERRTSGQQKVKVEKIEHVFGADKIIELLIEVMEIEENHRPLITIYKGKCIADLS
jgi:hypothetical protein